MNLGLMMKSWREVGAMTLLYGAGALAFEALVAFVLWNYFEELSGELLEIAFIRDIFQALYGSEIDGAVDPQAFRSIAWVHPLFMAILWAHCITLCTRLPAGEIDRGTIDVLLALPVSRRELYLSESAVWMIAGMAVISMALLGNALGHLGAPAAERPDFSRMAVTAVNCFAVYAAVGGIAWLVSSLSDRRGRAVGTVFAIVMAHFIWNFLGAYWQPAEDFGYLSILDHYQPAAILRDGTVPWGDLTLLFGGGFACWAAGGLIFHHRDVCTR